MIVSVLRPALHAVACRLFPARGQHRRPLLLPDQPQPAMTVGGQVLSEEALLDGWPEHTRIVGAVVAQCFEDCPKCERATAGALTKDGWRCGECLTPVPAGGVSRG